MRTKTKIILAVLMSFIMFFSMNNYIYASSFNFSATSSSSSVKPGGTVTVDLKISAIDAGELGINTIEASLEYDENVFEPVTQSSFSGANNWSITYNGEEGENKGKFVAVIIQDGVKEDQSIGKLTLKVKSNTTATSSKVSFTGIKTNDGTNEITTQDKTVNIKITKSGTNNQNQGTDNQGNNGSGNNNSGNNNSGSNNSGTTKPGTNGSGSNGSGSNGSGSSSSGTSNPGTSNPGTSNPGASNPGTSNPGASGTGVSGSGVSDTGSVGGVVGSSQAPQTQTKDDTTAKSGLPYTGGKYDIIIMISLISVLAVIGVVSFVCYKKIDN